MYSQPTATRRYGTLAIASIGPLLLICGLIIHNWWIVFPLERFALSLLLALFVSILAWPIRRFLGWNSTLSLVMIWTIALIWFVGPIQIITVTFLALACAAIGIRLVSDELPARLGIATATGLFLISGICGWLLILPVHYFWSWCFVLTAAIWINRELLLDAIKHTANEVRQVITIHPRAATLTVQLIGIASTACWIPTMQVDDLAYHLRLPAQLLEQGQYVLDPVHQVWSLAPWASDVLQGIAAVLAGQHARGAVNALWLTLGATLLWSLVRTMQASLLESWGAVCLYATFPPLVWLAAGMQTELAAIVAMLSLVVAISSETKSTLWFGAIALAMLAALKTIHLFSAIPLVLWALWRYKKKRPPIKHLLAAILLIVLVGGSNYVFAWYVTGNPVFPLFNSFFSSPYLPLANFADPRWNYGLGISTIWAMTFNTDRFVEAWDGAIGINLIIMAGVWILAILRLTTRALALVASLTLLFPLIPMQYARYAYPSLVLLIAVYVIAAEQTLSRRIFVWSISAICLINLALQANSGWTHRSVALKRLIRSGGSSDVVLALYTPERLLFRDIPNSPGELVLATDHQRSYVAELAGRGRLLIEHHDPGLAAMRSAAEADRSGNAWCRLIEKSQARWLLVIPHTASDSLQACLSRGIFIRVNELNDAQLWRIKDPLQMNQ